MFLTGRVILWAMGGIPFVLIFSGLLGPWGALSLYNGVLLLLILLDMFTCPGSQNIPITRHMEEKLSLGTANPVIIKLTNKSRAGVNVLVRDFFPSQLGELHSAIKIFLPPGESREIKYSVHPSRRGEYSLGPMSVRVSGLLGLGGRQFLMKDLHRVRVYPNIRGISNYRLLSRKNRLLREGMKPSRLPGAGTDFESLRDYVPGDEYRRINWKATARRSRLVASQYQAEKSQNIFVVIEAGRMMAADIEGLSRFDHAINSALLLSYVAMEKGDRVGLMVFADEILAYIPPKRGRKQLNRIIESLYGLEPRPVEADYRRGMGYLTARNRKRSLVVLYTDLVDEEVSRSVLT